MRVVYQQAKPFSFGQKRAEGHTEYKFVSSKAGFSLQIYIPVASFSLNILVTSFSLNILVTSLLYQHFQPTTTLPQIMHFLNLSPSSLSLCCHGMVSSQNLEFIKFFHFRYGRDGQRYGRQDLPAPTEADGRPGPRRRTASFKPVPPGKAGPRPAILLLLILAGRENLISSVSKSYFSWNSIWFPSAFMFKVLFRLLSQGNANNWL